MSGIDHISARDFHFHTSVLKGLVGACCLMNGYPMTLDIEMQESVITMTLNSFSAVCSRLSSISALLFFN